MREAALVRRERAIGVAPREMDDSDDDDAEFFC